GGGLEGGWGKRGTEPNEAMVARARGALRLSVVFVLAQQLAETRIVPDAVHIAVFAHVAEIAIPQFDGPPQRLERRIGPLQEGEAARQIVMHERIAGPELDEPLVDVKAFGVA